MQDNKNIRSIDRRINVLIYRKKNISLQYIELFRNRDFF